MRPVENLTTGVKLTDHKDAKPFLIQQMGEYCCYCEKHVDPQELHVEHIKPQKFHSSLSLVWPNFLLACSSCNTYKRHYQTSRQIGILNNQIWPHLDNTFAAYEYHGNGIIKVASSGLNSSQKRMAKATLEMAGLDKTPAISATYKSLGLSYDKVSKRAEAWKKIQTALNSYQQNQTAAQLDSILEMASTLGYFSLWLLAFCHFSNVKIALVNKFQADATCFNGQGNPIIPRRTRGI